MKEVKNIIEVRNLSCVYQAGTPYEHKALDDVSFSIGCGDFLGIAGSTGSGKSTLIKHFNGLLRPSSGSVLFNGEDMNAKGYDRLALRGKVGLVFQFPEYQLFEETVLRDVMFGPLNLGMSSGEARDRAVRALEKVGMGKAFLERSPFALSGGEKRRVALAGVLAMEPQVLVLDEPAAGLDPASKRQMYSLLSSLNASGITIVLVSHSMEDIAEYCSSMILLEEGHLADCARPCEVFSRHRSLMPFAMRVASRLKEAGFALGDEICTVDELVRQLGRKD